MDPREFLSLCCPRTFNRVPVVREVLADLDHAAVDLI